MCLYPRLIRNPKYIPNKKNKGIVPRAKDSRVKWVAIGCGECIECKKKKSREWRVRLLEEFEKNKECSFITLTFSEENLKKYRELASKEIEKNTDLYCDIWEVDNKAAKIAIRHMLERYRKENGKSIKHWLITERGHKNTRRIHIHGIIWTKFKQKGRGNKQAKDLTELWKNGWTYNGKYVGEKTMNYISKYITKADSENKHYHGKIYCSPGIGRRYIDNERASKRNIFDWENTDTNYILKNGKRIDLPMYYRNHLYKEWQREYLWIHLMNQKKRYVLGREIDITYGLERYESAVSIGRQISENAGYQSPEWTTEEYKKEYIERVILINQNKNVILQNNYKNDNHGTIETNQGYRNENDTQQLQDWSPKARNIIHTTGGLLDIKNLHDRKEQTIRLWNATERYNNIDRWNNNRKNAYNEMRERDTDNNIITNHESKTGKETSINAVQNPPGNDQTSIAYRSADGRISRFLDRDNRSGYECIDIETGEIYTKEEYHRIKNQLKTIKYEKNSRKGVRADGSKYTWYSTKRFVQKIGKDQLELF